MFEDVERWSRVVTAVRWSARVAGTFLAGFFLVFLIAHAADGVPRGLSRPDAIALLAIVVMVAGLLAAWRWEGAGAVLVLGGFAAMAVATGRLVPHLLSPYGIFPLLGLMFALCFVSSRKQGGSGGSGGGEAP